MGRKTTPPVKVIDGDSTPVGSGEFLEKKEAEEQVAIAIEPPSNGENPPVAGDYAVPSADGIQYTESDVAGEYITPENSPLPIMDIYTGPIPLAETENDDGGVGNKADLEQSGVDMSVGSEAARPDVLGEAQAQIPEGDTTYTIQTQTGDLHNEGKHLTVDTGRPIPLDSSKQADMAPVHMHTNLDKEGMRSDEATTGDTAAGGETVPTTQNIGDDLTGEVNRMNADGIVQEEEKINDRSVKRVGNPGEPSLQQESGTEGGDARRFDTTATGDEVDVVPGNEEGVNEVVGGQADDNATLEEATVLTEDTEPASTPIAHTAHDTDNTIDTDTLVAGGHKQRGSTTTIRSDDMLRPSTVLTSGKGEDMEAESLNEYAAMLATSSAFPDLHDLAFCVPVDGDKWKTFLAQDHTNQENPQWASKNRFVQCSDIDWLWRCYEMRTFLSSIIATSAGRAMAIDGAWEDDLDLGTEHLSPGLHADSDQGENGADSETPDSESSIQPPKLELSEDEEQPGGVFWKFDAKMQLLEAYAEENSRYLEELHERYVVPHKAMHTASVLKLGQALRKQHRLIQQHLVPQIEELNRRWLVLANEMHAMKVKLEVMQSWASWLLTWTCYLLVLYVLLTTLIRIFRGIKAYVDGWKKPSTQRRPPTIQRAHSSDDIAHEVSQRLLPHKSTIQSLDLNDPAGRSNRSPSAGYSALGKSQKTSNSDSHHARFSNRDGIPYRMDSNSSLSGSRSQLKPLSTPRQDAAAESNQNSAAMATVLAGHNVSTKGDVVDTTRIMSSADSTSKPAPSTLQHKKAKKKKTKRHLVQTHSHHR